MNDERECTMERIVDIREKLKTRIMEVNAGIQDLGGLDFHVEGMHEDRFLTLSGRPVGSETEIAYWAFIDACRFDLPPSWTTPAKVDAFAVGEPASSGPGPWSSDPEVSLIQVRGVPHGSCSAETFFVLARLCEEWRLLDDWEDPKVSYGTTLYTQGRMKTCMELIKAGVVEVCMPRHGLGIRGKHTLYGVKEEARRLGLGIRTVPFEYRLCFPNASIVASPEHTTWQVIIYAPGAEEKVLDIEQLLTADGPGARERWRRMGELLGFSDTYITKRLAEAERAEHDGRTND